ncbi:MAG: PAS domain-containing protein [Rhodospirillum sp.]|nr:PAS domain-containing protein [Rhodospirillum sp.]MCF8490984.1 PAS domain-containing protein [Rhodospirillum sp.]MCF8499497.1 PAS domain-containing protein [Rhodospirillum sp.]
MEVLKSVDRTYEELVAYQSELESRNADLESVRAFMTSVLAAMTDVLLVCAEDGRVLEANRACQAVTGRSKEALQGVPVTDLFTDGDGTRITRDLTRLRSGDTIEAVERTLRTEKGSTPLELSITARRDIRGRYEGAVLIGRPMGELRRAYEDMEESHRALKEAQSQLVHSEKLASLGRLLAGVAHELNNPISFIYGNAHALDRYTRKFEEYFDRVEAGATRAELVDLRKDLKLDRAVRQMRSATSGALEGAERVRDIVESLRRLSAEGAGEIEPFDLRSTVETAAEWVIKGRASSIPVEIRAEGPVWVQGRPGHIQQVVMNLVQNALDAMADSPTPRVEISLSQNGDRVRLDVADTGPGVPEDLALKIFDPFFTTKPVGQGTGLGLSISYKIVTENNGTLSVANRPEGGALFRLTLPSGKSP